MVRKYASLVVVALMLITAFVPASAPAQQNVRGGGLTIPVSGTALPTGATSGTPIPVTGILTIQRFVTSGTGTDQTLSAVGVVSVATPNGVGVSQVTVPVRPGRAPAAGAVAGASAAVVAQQATGVCDILTLDLQPIHLDLLGLVVDLSAVHLAITAEQGPGNLLGNLLCAIVGLLDPGAGITSQLAGLLNNLVGILGGL